MSSPREGAVNWLTGMLLGPEHLLAQERFLLDVLRWSMRHCFPGAGLVGAGARAVGETAPRGGDPALRVEDDGESLRLALSAVRGITPSGQIVEVGDGHVLELEIPRASLEGLASAPVHVEFSGDYEEDDETLGADPVNPGQAAFRRPRYRLRLGASSPTNDDSLLIARVRRAEGARGFVLDPDFIPPCVFVISHSVLHASWQATREGVTTLTARFGTLHARIGAFADHVTPRGVDGRDDREIRRFAERAALALEDCLHQIPDALSSPGRFLREMDRLGRRIALALRMSDATRSLLQGFSSAGSGYEVVLEERDLLWPAGSAGGAGDLRGDLERVQRLLEQLRRLCEALELRYLDYRTNPAAATLRILVDRGGEGFYQSVATPAFPQREGPLLTFAFSRLDLPGPHEYRVLLAADAEGSSPWREGETLEAEIRVNPGGSDTRPISRTLQVEVRGQRNFGLDFVTPPEVASIDTLRVTVQQHGPRIFRAALFRRSRGLERRPPDGGSPAAPLGPERPTRSLAPLRIRGGGR